MYPSPSLQLIGQRPIVFAYHTALSSVSKTKPGGAIKARIRIICFGQGGDGQYFFDEGFGEVGPYAVGGRGGNFAQKTALNVTALSALYIEVGGDGVAVRQNDGAGTVVARAGLDATSSDVGDIKQAGSPGGGLGYPASAGGAAAGAAYGAPAGAGSSADYGSGGWAYAGPSTHDGPGGLPWIEIAWIF